MLTLSIALATRIFGSLPVNEVQVLPRGALQLGHGHVDYALLGIFPVGVLGALGLFALLQFTDMGLAMRGAAQNRRGAALRGIDPDRTTMLAWVIGGAYAALAGRSVRTQVCPWAPRLYLTKPTSSAAFISTK